MCDPPGVSRGPLIDKSLLSDVDHIPDIPVYSPTWDEFRDFSQCISKIEAMGAHHIGLCKVIPPKDWVPRPEGYMNIDHWIVEKPVYQVTHGSHGIFFQEIVTRKSISFKEFRSLAYSSPYITPNHRDLEHLEKKYWASISIGKPIYGANVSGSLTTNNDGWNIAQLDSMLSRVLCSEGVTIPGVNTPYLYYGMWRSTFSWHVEDVDLYSINYVHFGAPKYWYVIPPAYARRFEALVFEYFRADFVHCHCFLRHKCVLIHPGVLEKAGIPTRKIAQNAGEFMITFPYAYHSGFNTGLNVAESTNFALPRWIDFGKKAKICHCWDDTVKINMDPFVKLYQPHLYADWIKGIDMTPHPLNDYSNVSLSRGARCLSGQSGNHSANATASNEIVSISNRYASNRKRSSGSVPGIVEVALDTFEIGDLNALDVRYLAKYFVSGPTPYHLQDNRIMSLWCSAIYDPRQERRFNHLIGSFEPHCAVCCFLWSPQHFGKVINSLPPSTSLPECSVPHIPEVAYSHSGDLPTNFDLSSLNSSAILRCSRCSLTVHAKCYGVSAPSRTNTLDQSPQRGAKSLSAFWHCDACLAPTRPSCLLCYMRGGAMKPLANPVNQYTGRPYWAHIVCSLANPGCRFVDIRRRFAAVSSEAIRSVQSGSRGQAKRIKMETSSDELSVSAQSLNELAMSKPIKTVRHADGWFEAKMTSDTCSNTPHQNFLDALLSGVAIDDLFPEVTKASPSTSSNDLPFAQTSKTGNDTRTIQRQPKRVVSCGGQAVRSARVSNQPSSGKENGLCSKPKSRSVRAVCVVCKKPSRGNLPMAKCWHSGCSMRYHVTCAQMAGVMIGTDMYPNMFYLACDDHPTTYLTNHSTDTEVHVGQKLVVRKPGNPPTFVKATAVRMTTPMYCRVAFPDGTFSKDTPPEYLTDVDWVHHGTPDLGSTVKVLWDDELEYTATFQGITPAKWQVMYKDKKKEILSRDQFFVRKPTKAQRKAYRPEPWEIPVCFGSDNSSDSLL